MDVNWYATEREAHQRLAELRAAVARCRPSGVEPPPRRGPTAASRLVRLGQRVLQALVAARAVAWRRLG